MINRRRNAAADLYFYLRAFISAANWGCSRGVNVQTATTYLNVSLLFWGLICLRGESVFVSTQREEFSERLKVRSFFTWNLFINLTCIVLIQSLDETRSCNTQIFEGQLKKGSQTFSFKPSVLQNQGRFGR